MRTLVEKDKDHRSSLYDDAAKAALDRITLPQDVLDRIAPTALPRSSLIISDEPLHRETNYRTEFVIALNDQPQGGIINRSRGSRAASSTEVEELQTQLDAAKANAKSKLDAAAAAQDASGVRGAPSAPNTGMIQTTPTPKCLERQIPVRSPHYTVQQRRSRLEGGGRPTTWFHIMPARSSSIRSCLRCP